MPLWVDIVGVLSVTVLPIALAALEIWLDERQR